MTTPLRTSISLAPRLDEVARAVAWARGELPSWVDPVRLDVGLTEALTNAIVHGALEVSSELRTAGVEVYLGEVDRRSNAPGTLDKSVTLTITQWPDLIDIGVFWQGAPCPSQFRGASKVTDPLRGSGLGTTLIYASFDEVVWGADGYSLCLKLYPPRKGFANAPL